MGLSEVRFNSYIYVHTPFPEVERELVQYTQKSITPTLDHPSSHIKVLTREYIRQTSSVKLEENWMFESSGIFRYDSIDHEFT